MVDPLTPPGDAQASAPGEPVSGSGAPGQDRSIAAIAADASENRTTGSLRRAPKYTVFLLLGAALGVIAALILTTVFNGSGQVGEAGFTYTFGQVFGFLSLICVPVGLAAAGMVALILDRAAARRAREFTIERERIRVQD